MAYDKKDAAHNLVAAAEAFNDERENCEQYLSDIEELSDFDFTMSLDELDEDALSELESNVPSASDLRALRDSVADMIRAAEEFEAALEDAKDYLDTEYEVVVVFTVKAGSEDGAEKVVSGLIGNGSVEYDIEETREV